MRILLVEDDPRIGDAIRARLSRAGMTVDWLDDGASLEGGTDLIQTIRGVGSMLPRQ